MTTAIKRRRGTTVQHSSFTGLEGELTVDTTKETVVVHDGVTAGGFPLARESQATTNAAITGGTINGTTVGATTAAAGAFTSLTASTTLGVTGVATLGNGAILGIPASGTITNLTGTASININGTVGATTPGTGAFTTVTASGLSTFSTSIRAVGMTDTALTGAGNQAGFMLISSGDYMGMRSNTNHDLIIESYTKSEALKIANTTGLVTMAYGAAVTGDITASTGNIVIGTAGKGIDFSATASGSGTMTSELLADYEEGTWSVQLQDVSNNNATMESTFVTATYVKIGRQVTVCGTVYTTSVAGLSGGIRVSGLPFASGSGDTFRSAGATSNEQLLNISSGQKLSILITSTLSTKFEIYISNSAAGGTQMTAAEWSNDGFAQFSLTYFTA